MASGDKVYIADKTTLDSVNTKVGSSSDSASSSGTTLFALLKDAVSNVSSLATYWTSARATKVDGIGSSSDTASSSGTTLFALLKQAVTDSARLTSTRAGYIDRIANSTYGLDKIKTAVDTASSNASSATTAIGTVSTTIGATGDTGGSATAGTVMGKLNGIFTNAKNASSYASSAKTNTASILNSTGKHYVPSTTSLGSVTVQTTAISISSGSYNYYRLSDFFYPKADGIVKVTVNSVSGTVNRYSRFVLINTAELSTLESGSLSAGVRTESAQAYIDKLISTAIGTKISSWSIGTTKENSAITQLFGGYANDGNGGYDGTYTATVNVPVKRGYPIFVAGIYTYAGSASAKFQLADTTVYGTLTTD